MPLYHTLEAGGTEQTLAAWGIALESVVGEFGSGIMDTLRCAVPQTALAAAPAFDFEDRVVFRLSRTSTTGGADSFTGGSVEFIGYRLDPAHDDLPGGRMIHYTFGNAWHFLASALFEQKRASRPTETVDLAFPWTTDVCLGMKLGSINEYVELTTGEQITVILQFVLDYFAEQGYAQPFIIGTIDPDLPMPTYRASEVWCASALLKCLETSPDCTVFFDYSTLVGSVPTPTIHVRRRANLTPVTLALADNLNHQSLRIVPRPTLQLRSVVLQYKITGTNEQRLWNAYVTDKYGPNGANHASDPERGHRVLKQTFDLQGSTFTSAYLDTQLVNCNFGTGAHGAGRAERRAWWAQFVPELGGTKTRLQDHDGNAVILPNATIVAAQAWGDFAAGDAVDLANFPYWLRPNVAVLPWMSYLGSAIQTVPVIIKTTIQKRIYEADAPAGGNPDAVNSNPSWQTARHVKSQEISTHVMLCNAPPGTYSNFSAGEDVPVGIAQKYFEALSAVQYSGENVRVQTTPTGLITLANTLNLSNGRAEWATMTAQVQMIRKEYGWGRTSVTFGPPTLLTPDARLGIWRYNRSRVASENPRLRATAQLPANSEF